MSNFNIAWIISLQDKFSAVGKKAAKVANKIEKSFKKSNVSVNKYTKGTAKLRAIQQRANRIAHRLTASTGKVHNKFTLMGVAAHSLKNKINRLNSSLRKTTFATNTQTNSFNRLQSVWTKLLGIAAVGLAIAFPLRQAIQFESTMAEVRKVVDFPTPKAFKDFSIAIVEMSKFIPVAARELGDIAAAGGRFGVEAKDLPRFIKDVAKTTVAWDTTASDTATSMASLANVLSKPIDKISEITNVINHLSNSMATTAPKITEVVLRSGQLGKSIGLTDEQIAAMATTMLVFRVRQQKAGMALQMMFGRFARLAGKYPKFGKMFLADPHKAIMSYLKREGQIANPLKRLAGLTRDFDEESARHINKLIMGAAVHQKALDLVAQKTKIATSILDEYNIRVKTTGKQLQLLKDNAIALSIKFGNLFLPAINKTAKGLIEVISAFESLVTGMPFVTKLIVKLTVLFVSWKVAVFALAIALKVIAAHPIIAPIIAGLVVMAYSIESIIRNVKKLHALLKEIGGFKGFFGAAKGYFKAPEDIGKQAYAAAQQAAALRKQTPDYQEKLKQLTVQATQAFKGSLDISIDDKAGKVSNMASHNSGPVEVNTHLNVGPNIAHGY